MCYHAEFGRYALKGVGINTGEPQRLGSPGGWNSTFLGWEAWLTPRYMPSPRVTMSNLVVLRQRVYAKIEGNPQSWEAVRPHPLGVGGH